MIKKPNLKIGDIIYSYNSKVSEYKIIEIQHLETESHKEKFYIVECTVCQHGSNCKIALKINNSKNLEYSHMINQYDYDDEDYPRNNEYYWHTGDCFFTTRTEARLFVHNKSIDYYKANIKKAEETIEYNKKCIEESEEKINSLLEQKEELK